MSKFHKWVDPNKRVGWKKCEFIWAYSFMKFAQNNHPTRLFGLSVTFLIFSLTHTVERCQVLSCLPATYNQKISLYLKSIEDQATSWTTFTDPFSRDLWLMIIIVALIMAGFFTCVGQFFSKSDKTFCFKEYCKYVWVSIKANFGGELVLLQDNAVVKIILFSCSLVGVIIWGAYQASLTSELSIIKLKLPFIDLETLLKSDYK